MSTEIGTSERDETTMAEEEHDHTTHSGEARTGRPILVFVSVTVVAALIAGAVADNVLHLVNWWERVAFFAVAGLCSAGLVALVLLVRRRRHNS